MFLFIVIMDKFHFSPQTLLVLDLLKAPK